MHFKDQSIEGVLQIAFLEFFDVLAIVTLSGKHVFFNIFLELIREFLDEVHHVVFHFDVHVFEMYVKSGILAHEKGIFQFVEFGLAVLYFFYKRVKLKGEVFFYLVFF